MTTEKKKCYWIFLNNKSGYNGDGDWDISTVIRTNRYYLKENDTNGVELTDEDLKDY